MSVSTYGWTKPLPLASRSADPSGIQDAGTALQASLLPGMSTVTPNVRYISLFAAAQYWRHDRSQHGYKLVNYREFLRRFEALIALSSVCHHKDADEVPTGVVGRTFADSEIAREYLRLDTGNIIPPYNIYRGTLGGLGLFNLDRSDDPLFEGAIPIGQAWDIAKAGKLGDYIKRGSLPERIRRHDIDSVADAFCLCKVPPNSEEQHSLVNLLFGLDKVVDKPSFDGEALNSEVTRVASWRLLLDIVDHSKDRRLDTHYLMGRLLEPDLLDISPGQTLRATLFLWRWVAARSLFELGWTTAFRQAFDVVRARPYGVGHNELIELVREQYSKEHDRNRLTDLAEQAKAGCSSGNWITEKFNSATSKNCILLMISGAFASGEDLNRSQLTLLSIIDSEREIPFSLERERLSKALLKDILTEEYWADISGEALVQHTRIALRKMAQGNPDTQHVEFEDGRWATPPGRDSWNPRQSTGFSRLDIAIGWLHQLGLVRGHENDSWSLTAYGRDTRKRWDEVYKSWP